MTDESTPDTEPSAPATPAPDPASVSELGSVADAPSAPDRAAAPEPDAGASVPPSPPAPRVASARRPGAAIVAFALVAVLAGSALFVSGWSLGRQSALTPGTPVDEAAAFQPFWDAYRAVTERYAGGSVDRRTIIEGAIKGMIGALGDPYSQYLTPEEFQQTLRDISGEFEGIGATIGTVDAKGNTSSCSKIAADCRLVIVAPITGSPADKADLEPGDVITKIDGTALDGLTVDQARSRIRGPKDTSVILTVKRGSKAPHDVDIIRGVIITPEVEARDLAAGTVGYIRLSGFSDHSAQALDAVAATDIKAGRTKLILDLRGNPGGFVTAAREVASQFLSDGTIFWEEDADSNLTEVAAKPGGAATDPAVKLVVLVDGGSASASEIVAGALHDRGRATLVGTKTFGKGTVQQWTQLEENSGGFRLTIAKWLTPNRTWIHGVGITPDVVVDTAPARPGDDPVLNAALGVLGATGLQLRAAA
jgi:carboxyl-terminal processing protease